MFARSVIRAGICKVFCRQLLCTQTPRGWGRDAQLAPCPFKLLKTSCSHQGPLRPPRPRAHRYLRPAGLLGKPMLENLGFSQLRFVSAAGPWLRFSGLSRCRSSRQGQADGAAAGAKCGLNTSRATTCTQLLAPAPTLAWAHLLLRQPSACVVFFQYGASNWALSPPAWCNTSVLSLLEGWPPETHWGMYPKTQTLSLFSLLLGFPHPTKCSGSELIWWGWGWGERLRKDLMRSSEIPI